MITIRTMKQIPTSGMIASFRSASLLHRPPSIQGDRARMAAGQGRMLAREARRRWLNAMYADRSGLG